MTTRRYMNQLLAKLRQDDKQEGLVSNGTGDHIFLLMHSSDSLGGVYNDQAEVLTATNMIT